MNPALIAIAAEVGAPIVKKILEKKLGAGNADLAGNVIDAIAREAGVAPDEIEEMAATNPNVIREAIRTVEEISPELIDLYSQGLKGQFALLQAEQADPAWMRAWRPGWMYLLGCFWLWNIIVLHVINAIWKIALPVTPFAELMALTGAYLALYMGGHTVKAVTANLKAQA